MDKSSLYSTLTGASLFFLLAFLIYWNIDHYKRIKQDLKQDLTDQMELAVAEYQDSLIQDIFRVIEVDSFGSRDLDLSVQISTDDATHLLTSTSHDIRGRNDNHTRQESSDFFFVPEESTNPDTALTVMYDEERERKIIVWNSDITQDSFKLNYDTTEVKSIDLSDLPELGSITKRVENITMISDSSIQELPRIYARLHTIYNRRLQQANINIDHLIETPKQQGAKDLPFMAIAFTYGNLHGDERPYAVFKNAQAYILKKISPNILLSLLLLGAVGVSFYLILSNMKAQLGLTAVKDEFISNMTHELKTPIATVGVALEALDNFGVIDDKKKRQEYLDISKHELERLKILVDKVLKMSTLDQDLDTINFTDINIKELTESMLHSMSLHFKKHGADVDYTSSGEDYSTRGDKIHLVNVLYNIIDNAIKYSRKDPKINIQLDSTDHHISISIKDNGPGISKEYLPRIFDRLFRVPNHARHNVKGHGLGLHYAKSVIEKHRGSIAASSELGKSTTFLIKLPRTN